MGHSMILEITNSKEFGPTSFACEFSFLLKVASPVRLQIVMGFITFGANIAVIVPLLRMSFHMTVHRTRSLDILVAHLAGRSFGVEVRMHIQTVETGECLSANGANVILHASLLYGMIFVLVFLNHQRTSRCEGTAIALELTIHVFHVDVVQMLLVVCRTFLADFAGETLKKEIFRFKLQKSD